LPFLALFGLFSVKVLGRGAAVRQTRYRKTPLNDCALTRNMLRAHIQDKGL